jgi:Ca2+/Na+ antiporter
MAQRRFKRLFPVVLFFLALNAFFVAGKTILDRVGADQDVLIIGNVLLFLITMISFTISLKGLNSPNTHAFIRSVYGSILLKLFICIIAAFVYIALFKKNLNKPALFSLMGLYLVYTFIEVSVLTKLLRQRNP